MSEINAIVAAPLAAKPPELTDAEYAQTLADRAIFANKVAVGVYFALDTPGTDMALAKQALAGVTADTASVDAAKQIAVGGGTPSGPTPRLIVGTDGDDVFDVVPGDVNAVDTIDGLGGNDTLNYVDASTTGISFPAATVKNVETINIRNVNTAGTVAETALMNVSYLRSEQTLSVGGLTLTATALTEADEIIDAIVNGRSTANLTVSGTLTGYTATAGSGTVTFTSTVTGNVPDLVATTTGGFGIPARVIPMPDGDPVELIIMQGLNGAVGRIDASNFADATRLNTHTSSAAVVFSGVKTGQVVGMIGDAAMKTGPLAVDYASSVTSAVVEIAAGTRGGSATLIGSGLADIVIKSTGAANTLDGVALSPATSSLAIDAEANIEVSIIAGAGLERLAITGAAARVALGEVTSAVLASVDASAFAGDVAVTLGAAAATTFKGGAGNDVVTVATTGTIGGEIDGGGGNNALVLSAGTSLSTGAGALIRNIQTVQLSAAAGTTQTYDLAHLAGFAGDIQIKQSAGHVALTNVTGDTTVTGAINGSLSLALADASGGNDAVSLTLDNLENQAQRIDYGFNVQELKAVGVETLTLHVNGVVHEEGGHYGSYAVVNSGANASLSRVVIDGSQALDYTTGLLENGVAMTIDGSAATGALKLVGQNATKRVDIQGGSAADTIYAGRAGGTLHGAGGGDDLALSTGVDTVVYKNASESSLDLSIRAGNPGAKMDVISGFTAGTDKIDLTALQINHTTGPAIFTRTYASTDALLAATNAGGFYSEGGEQRVAVSANVGEFRYLLIDVDQDGEFNAEADLAMWFIINWGALQDNDLIFTNT